MPGGYQPSEIEARHYRRWEQNGYFAASGQGEPYCIVIPPPNVTGTLHMGHAFQDTIMDALTRYHRMSGRNTLWQPGTDHAGIATQMVVERILDSEGTSRLALGREAFLERVWQWKERSGNRISQQLRRLGASVDWSRERFTMDPDLSRAVLEVFVTLYEEGLIYRGKRLVNWDPVLETALSDLEVLPTEEQGKLWRFRYPFADAEGYLVVATTRPETMLGDTAVAVHPDDERYRHLVGGSIDLPLTGRRIPIVADTYVDPTFGTGCVKITPAHDFNDYELGQRHNLPLINIFDARAHLNDEVPSRYRGLERFAARERVLADLEAAGLLEGTEDHTLMVPRGDRSGAVVEPLLTDQWYVRVQPLAEPAIAAVESGRVRFVPENWSKTYFDWMHNIQDWCISRQLWWGHRIPAWYDEAGNVYVGRSEQEVRAKHALAATLALRQDEDVLDTWFSSALWPFSTMGWPERTRELETFYPTSVLVTGFDIIFFWVARMIMMGLKFMDDVPFREVYVHALVRDHEGQKMSKSKGNVLDPLDLVDGIDLDALLAKRTEGLMQPQMKARIEQVTRKEFPDGIPAFGTDALRLTFASLATTGRDARFDMARVDGFHRFCNKLWNAAEFAFGHMSRPPPASVELSVADRWIRSRLAALIRQVHAEFAEYRFDLVTQAIYDFVWHEFCDWYLELTKPVLYDAQVREELKSGARTTLSLVLDAVLKLLHPLAPFATEELWLELGKRVGAERETLMLERLPAAGDFQSDAEAEAEIEWTKQFIVSVRQIRGEMNVSPSKRLDVVLAGASAKDQRRVMDLGLYLHRLAALGEITLSDDEPGPRGSATAVLGEMRLYVPLGGLIDLDAERARLDKQRMRLVDDHDRCQKKLDNTNFVANAPADIVAKEKARYDELGQRIGQLERQLQRLTELE